MTRSSDLVMVEREVLEATREALSRCYDVCEWPSDGSTRQDAALRLLTDVLSPRPSSDPEGGARGEADALHHLGNVLAILAELHPDDRSNALDGALAFYNARCPNAQVEPVAGVSRLVHQWPGPSDQLTKTPSADHDGCICQNQHRRGYCNEPGCQFAPNHQPHAVSQGWQDIENAPRDGTPFLCFHPDDVFSAQTGIDLIWYEPSIKTYTMDGDNEVPFAGITHWMPLPAPPSPAKTGGWNEHASRFRE